MIKFEQELRSGMQELGIQVSETQVEQLQKFASLLQRWNKVYNLTSIKKDSDILTHHLLDSASLVPFVGKLSPEAKTVLDVGSGGGLPSIPLAILRPDLQVTAVDAVKKKTAFLTQVAIELGLRNYRVLHCRVEAMKGSYDIVTSRAFASLEDFTGLTKNLVKSDGIWLAMKGQEPQDEIAKLAYASVVKLIPLNVPGLDEERHLVVMESLEKNN